MKKDKIQAIGITLGGLAIGTFLAMGNAWHSNYKQNHNKLNISPSDEMSLTKVYSPLSYLEIRSKGEYIQKISQKSSLTNKIILEFNLNPRGEVEKMTEDSFISAKTALKVSYPGDGKKIDWTAINKTAQGYIAYFEKK